MDVETWEVDKGIRINIETDQRVALVVCSGEEERIYLPETEGSDSTYYVEKTGGLEKYSSGYSVIHPGEVESLEILK